MNPLVERAHETMDAIARGEYVAPSGKLVKIGDAVAAAVRGTVLHEHAPPWVRGDFSTKIELTCETTAEAGRRLVEREQAIRVAALNFASAKHPGGGFLTGAKAQEEDLARASALYACLEPQRSFYEGNRGSLLYTDRILYSPSVPFFRDERGRFLESPFALSILTAPAPNAGAALARDPSLTQEIRETLFARAKRILAVAAAHGDRTLVLGAWGCGVFRNDPSDVALAFSSALDGDFRGAFERVVFAVYDPGGRNLRALERRFGPAAL